MAVVDNINIMNDLQKNNKILVNVDEVLPDLIIVTYAWHSKLFQGALLDSTKKNLAFGINSIHPLLDQTKIDLENKDKENNDKLYSVSQRFDYQFNIGKIRKEKQSPIRRKPKAKEKMTIRLRPRQVLCSKCRGICNENSENVEKKRKTENSNGGRNKSVDEYDSSNDKKKKLEDNALKSVRLADDSLFTNTFKTLVPKLKRLDMDKIKSIIDNGTNGLNSPSDDEVINRDPLEINNANDLCDNGILINDKLPINNKNHENRNYHQNHMLLRKKRNINLVDDNELSDENETRHLSSPYSNLNNQPKMLKISYGHEGEGTVVKIPNFLNNEDSTSSTSSKSDKKSKKKKRSKRKDELDEIVKIDDDDDNSNDATSEIIIVDRSDSKLLVEKPTQLVVNKKHKHKSKKRKKVRTKSKHVDDDIIVSDDPLFISESEIDIRKDCLNQKLSINLKRVNEDLYANCDNANEFNDSCNNSSLQFPKIVMPVKLPKNVEEDIFSKNQSLTPLAYDANGNKLLIGDIVWGKIPGFPWWPGKVLQTTKFTHNNITSHQAHIAWYGSTTTSVIACNLLNPFLKNFKLRYNKKKRGIYKDAIKQARSDALDLANGKPHVIDIKNPQMVQSTTTPSPPPPPTRIRYISPPLASPPEINVMS